MKSTFVGSEYRSEILAEISAHNTSHCASFGCCCFCLQSLREAVAAADLAVTRAMECSCFANNIIVILDTIDY
jgi:hypothetical protein